ncbi:hypothetical protein LB557_18890 [Mesorhizobium sp. BR115XR7A]|uniref:hypothetical protein n=1 Tax=Mesorhizobium sp. BR115XR7A TaxID=2876645 RepID=UPI001CCE0E0E|nr:hypothetical protein [Mesorhizobium sp. BR115XR7A]MBZ9908081.1 hypothetical protein [Mesorhizobium sp. BR115XR7A]MBZ9930985.1 hypothetical protein [Mesorhizobium sp. BR1-1-5]
MVDDEQRAHILDGIRRDIPRALLVDIQQDFPIGARQAEVSVKVSTETTTGGVMLSRKRESKAVGLIRHQVFDEMFEKAIVRNGGEFVSRVKVEFGPDVVRELPVYLTTGRFGGTLVGFASHRDADDAPVKNATRLALCGQNRGLDVDLFRAQESFTDRERFVVIMVQRDPFAIGKLASISIGVADTKVEQFIVLEKMEEFLAGYGTSRETPRRGIALRSVARSFKDTIAGAESDQAKG